MDCYTKGQFCPHFLKQMLPKVHYELDVSITYDKLWHPVMFNPYIDEQFCRIKSCHDHLSWSHFFPTWKINRLTQGWCSTQGARSWSPWKHFPIACLGLVEVCITHISFCIWTSCFGIGHKWPRNALHLASFQAIESFSYDHPCGFFPIVPCHGHIMIFVGGNNHD
jgi:hypothetical protein